MGIDFYNLAVEIIGQVPNGSVWLYDIGTLLLIILTFALVLGLPIYLIITISNR